MNQKSIINLALLLVLSLLWAGTFVFVKIADQTLNPFVIMAARAIISTIALFILLPLSGRNVFCYFKQWKFQCICFISSLLIAFMWLSIGYSEKVLSAAMATLLITALVPITWLISVLILREKKFYAINFVGIVIATAGMIGVIGVHNVLHANHSLYASLLYISGLVTFAFAATINKRFAANVDPLITVAFNLFYIAIILTIATLLQCHQIHGHFTAKNVTALIALGAGSTGIGYLIYFYLSHRSGLVYAALSSYLVPVMGLLLGYIFLHETMHWQQIAGLAIVLFGMWFIQKQRS